MTYWHSRLLGSLLIGFPVALLSFRGCVPPEPWSLACSRNGWSVSALASIMLLGCVALIVVGHARRRSAPNHIVELWKFALFTIAVAGMVLVVIRTAGHVTQGLERAEAPGLTVTLDVLIVSAIAAIGSALPYYPSQMVEDQQRIRDDLNRGR